MSSTSAYARRAHIRGCLLFTKFVPALHDAGLLGSMGHVGACADNAAVKSLIALLQKNVLSRKRWTTREELRFGDCDLAREHLPPETMSTWSREVDSDQVTELCSFRRSPRRSTSSGSKGP